MKKLIVGIAGYAGSGKDTAAEALKSHGFAHHSFAAPLKDALLGLNPYIESEGSTLAKLVKKRGWDTAKQNKEVRKLLQRFGTECCRNHFGEDFWVDLLRQKISTDTFVVVSDVRFHNEGRFVRDNGLLLWIHRPGLKPANRHSSESKACKALAHAIIDNKGTVGELHEKVLHEVFYRHIKV